MELFIGFIIGAGVMLLIMRIMSIIALKRLDTQLDQVLAQIKEEIKIKEVTIEQQDDMFYVYDAKTGTFLAQGKTYKEVADILSHVFPTGTKFHCFDKDVLTKLLETQ